MLSGRLRRRALALLGALLLVILIWPPCCATMPKPLPAVLPTVPEIEVPSDPVPAVVVTNPPAQQQTTHKSRKLSELSRFMNVLLVGVGSVENVGYDRAESGTPRSTAGADNGDDTRRHQIRTLNLPRHESSAAGYPIAEPIDGNSPNEQRQQQTTSTAVTTQPRLDKDLPPTTTEESRLITHSPTIFSILSHVPSSVGSAATSPQVRAEDQVNERVSIVEDDNGQNAVNQSVFNPTTGGESLSSSPFYFSNRSPVRRHSRAVRSASFESQHHHRHQHYLTGDGTLAAAGGSRFRGVAGRALQHLHRNGTAVAADSDSSNLERNERSANLSHITGANRKIQLYIKNRYLQLLADGTVNGTHDDQSEFTILQRTTVAAGQIRIQGVATCLFLCMDSCSTVYGSREFTDDCVFNEQMEQHHYNTYSSTKHSNSRRTLYLALNKTGQPRKIQIPVNRTLGKLATYTKALTQTVAHDRVERLISRLFGANHVRHGLKQLCESGGLGAMQEMRPRPVCAAGKGPLAAGQTAPGTPANGGPNKDKDTKDTMRKKKKKRRKCREDETPGEHCFRPASAGGAGSSSGSLGTNNGRRRLAPGPAKSQKCSQEEVECAVSLSNSSSSGNSTNSANSVSIGSSSSSSSSAISISGSSRASTTVPNGVVDPAVTGVGSKKKVVKKVNNRNNAPHVNSKKSKKGQGGGIVVGGGGGPNSNRKTKQQHSSSSSVVSSISSSSSTVPFAARGKVRVAPVSLKPTRMTRTILTTMSTTTTTRTTTPVPVTTPALDDTSQSEDELEAELDMDDLLLHGSAEIIEEDELDEGNPNLTGQSLNFVDEENLNDMDF